MQKTAGSLGYADLYDVSVNPQSLIQVSVDGVPASAFTVDSNNYKFWTVEHMYTKGQASGLSQAFIDYMGNNNTRQIIQNSSFIDLYSMTNSALSERCLINGS